MNVVKGFSVMVVSAFPAFHKLLYAQTHRTNCKWKVMERRCKTIPTFGFKEKHCSHSQVMENTMVALEK